MSALTDLTDAVASLATSVDAAVAKLGAVPPDNSAQLVALKDGITAAKEKLDAAVAAAA